MAVITIIKRRSSFSQFQSISSHRSTPCRSTHNTTDASYHLVTVRTIPLPSSSSAEIKANVGLSISVPAVMNERGTNKRNNQSVTELSATPPPAASLPSATKTHKRAYTHPKLSGNCRILAISEKTPGKWKENGRRRNYSRRTEPGQRYPLVLALIHQFRYFGVSRAAEKPPTSLHGKRKKPAHHDSDLMGR